MKLNFIKKLSFFFIFSLGYSLIYSVTSCSNNNDVVNNNSIDKTNSIEYKDALFVTQADGSVLKYENNHVLYGLDLNTKIIMSRKTNLKTNSNTYRITNPQTGEFVDIVDIVEENGFFKFNALTSSGEKINDLKYYGNNFITSLQNFTNENSQKIAGVNKIQCGPCVTIVVSAVLTVMDSLQDSPLEQCRGAMSALKCSGDSNAYMQFSESWFSTTCNVGCR
jgi:hypothetical protein